MPTWNLFVGALLLAMVPGKGAESPGLRFQQLDTRIWGAFQISRIEATREQEFFFHPFSESYPAGDAAYGIGWTLETHSRLVLASGLQWNRITENMGTRTVTVAGSPFNHEFRVQATITRLSLPLLVGFRHLGQSLWWSVNLGPFVARVLDRDVGHFYDGRKNTDIAPSVFIQDNTLGLQASLESGVDWGRWGAYFFVQGQHDVMTMSHSLDGYSFGQALQLGLGLRRAWSF